MSVTVCIAPRSCLAYPQGGGYLWIFLNWALGLRAAGWNVIWLEGLPRGVAPEEARTLTASLKERLEPYGFADSLALYAAPGEDVPAVVGDSCLDVATAAEALVLLNFRYSLASDIVSRFRRSVLVDIDPGLLQIWIARGLIDVATHDVYVTIGEHVQDPSRTWHHVPPCVSLEWWPSRPAPADAPFTTVGHWYAGGWIDTDETADDKRSGFLPLVDIPRSTAQRLELALDLPADHPQARMLEASGWSVCNAHVVAATPWDYQRYVQGSRGELSCAKPAYTRLGNAWISDRTICYLASGKPAVVEHTGPSAFLSDDGGLLRFRSREEAALCIERVTADYPYHAAQARAIAEEHFDARRNAARVMELAE
jgi:hypothetical protein